MSIPPGIGEAGSSIIGLSKGPADHLKQVPTNIFSARTSGNSRSVEGGVTAVNRQQENVYDAISQSSSFSRSLPFSLQDSPVDSLHSSFTVFNLSFCTGLPRTL